MSRHRSRPQTRQRLRTRASIALIAVVAVTTSVLTYVNSGDSSIVADLGTSVSGRHARAIDQHVQASSSKTVTTPTKHLTANSWDLSLGGELPGTGLVTSASAGGTAARVSGAWRALGDTGLEVAAARADTSTGVLEHVTARVASRAAAKHQHLQGIVIKLTRPTTRKNAAPVAVKVPTKLLAQQFGADYAHRTRWVQLDGDKPYSAAAAVPVATVTSAKSVVLTPMLAARTVTLAATSATASSSGSGSFSATSMKESGSWDVSAQTGDFTWQYPMTAPAPPAGPSPNIALAYDSQSVDGETGSTNNQPSAVGDGWDLAAAGSIERRYVPCSQDDGASGPVKTSGDQCWKADNATLSLAGHNAALVRDKTSGTWKMQSDDGSRIEHLVGTGSGCSPNGTYDTDCWRVTTTDGTQYYFGKNQLPGWASGKATTNSTWTVPVFGNDAGEPCHASTFAASSCTQAWRWNLDYVVDVHGNAEAFYYDAETNSYGKNGSGATSYVRGGQLDHIDYGLTAATVYTANAASGRVTFGYNAYGRCSDSTHANCTSEAITAAATKPAKPTYYPDVPWDQFCTSACTATTVPSFWTDGMLDTVTTAVRSGSSYATVDKWTLSHSFPSPGDGTNAALWMTQVQHTGYSGSSSLTEPAVKFGGVAMQNRVWAVDGLAPLDKQRISSITSETGAVTSVNYSGQDCTPAEVPSLKGDLANNVRRCFPQWWTGNVVPAQEPKLDFFHKYVVTSVVDDPRTGGGNDRPHETSYAYTGKPAWRYSNTPFVPSKYRTWSNYAGYDTVEVRDGAKSSPADQQVTAYVFYRGLDGDRASDAGGTKSVAVTGAPGVDDSPWLAGRTRETVVRAGVGGAVISTTVQTPWSSSVLADDGTLQARRVDEGTSRVTEPTSSGATRSVVTSKDYDSHGEEIQEETRSSDAGSTCSTTTYAPANTTTWLVGVPLEEKVVDVPCDTETPDVSDVMSDVRTTYDNDALGAVPTRADPTKVETVSSYSGSAPVWTKATAAQFDAMGRVTSSTDEIGRTTATTYTPTTGGPVTAVTTTNVKGWKHTETLEPGRNSVVSVTDFDGSVTTASYDPLGRRTQVWMPGRAKAAFPSAPNYAYAYTESQTAPLAVATTSLNATGTTTAFTLYDGLGRQVQTQRPSSSGGSVVSDTAYDSQGRPTLVNNDYWSSGSAPSNKLFLPVSQQQIQSSVETQYDAVGRSTAEITSSYGVEKYRTTTRYSGADEVDVLPPAGGTPTSIFTNSLGKKTTYREYLGAFGSTERQDTRYTYDGRGALSSMQDPAGNRWSWSYDVLGRRVAANDPDAGSSTYAFDAAGRQTSSTDARGVTLTTQYDDLDRETARYVGGTNGAIDSSWTYDSVKIGQLSSSTRYVGSTPGHPGSAYTTSIGGYDGSNQPTARTVSIPADAPAFGGTTYTTKQAYNTDGSLASVTAPAIGGIAAERSTYTYNALGAPSSLAGIKSYAGLTYDALNRVAQVDRDGTVVNTTAYTRDAATGALTGILDQTGTGSSTVVQAKRTYTRNAAGSITSTSTTGAAGSEIQCYSYDSLQELTEAWTPTASCANDPVVGGLGGASPFWNSYEYDTKTGNRTSETKHVASGDVVSSYSYASPGSAQPHAVEQVAKATAGSAVENSTYDYDPAGNTIQNDDLSLSYGADGSVSSIQSGSGQQQEIYDAEGALLLQIDPVDGAALFLGDTELRQEPSDAEPRATRTYALAGVLIAERSVEPTGQVVKALDSDIDGNADLESSVSDGKVVRRWFDPFGNLREPSPTWGSKRGFLNAPVSDFSGLVQLGARAYDASLGRFLSVDPVSGTDNPRQNNAYGYGANDPVNNTDATGECYLAIGGGGNCGGGVEHVNPHAPSGINHGANGRVWVTIPRRPSAPRPATTYTYVSGVRIAQPHPVGPYSNFEVSRKQALAGEARTQWAAWQLGQLLDLFNALPLEGAAEKGAAAVGVAGAGGRATARTYQLAQARADAAAAAEAVASRLAANAAKGRAGEEWAADYLKMNKNGRRFDAPSGKVAYRIPDFFERGESLSEIKNVSRQGWTTQLQDFAEIAKEQGVTFNLYIRENTTPSSRLLQAEEDGLVTIHRVLPRS